VSYKTAEHVRRVAEQLGYRTGHMERAVSERGTGMLGIIVADIANPVFFGMIREAERAASDRGFTMLVVETQESEEVERARAGPPDSCGGWSDPELLTHVGLGDSLSRQAQTTGAAQPGGRRGVIGGE
jgi:hypothetical protein